MKINPSQVAIFAGRKAGFPSYGKPALNKNRILRGEIYGVTPSTTTSPEPIRTFASLRTCTLPRRMRPAAGAALAVTEPATSQTDLAGRRALASVCFHARC
jgi:hypothetical protein